LRRVVVAIGLVLAAVVAATAHGAQERDALVRPGVGIGKIRLGMTPAQVFRALGRTQLVNRRLDYGFGTRYVEYGWDYTSWSVGFTGRPNSLRVSKIATTLRRERTRGGVGVGTTVRALLRVYPNARCVGRWYSDPDPGTWVYIGRRPTITAFNIDYSGPGSRGHVAEVVVQRDWITRSRGRGCGPNWRTQ
jgi:hypothetical protein